MTVNRVIVETFLRISIFICSIALCLMLVLMLFDVGGWMVWTPGLIACVGVILGFGAHLNTLHGISDKPLIPGVAIKS